MLRGSPGTLSELGKMTARTSSGSHARTKCYRRIGKARFLPPAVRAGCTPELINSPRAADIKTDALPSWAGIDRGRTPGTGCVAARTSGQALLPSLDSYHRR